MIDILILAVLDVIGTVIMLGYVVLEDPPALFGYFFGLCNGAGWIGLFSLYALRSRRD